MGLACDNVIFGKACAMAIQAIQIEHKLWTVDEYEQMISAGVVSEDDPLELIQGEIVKMSPLGSLHIYVVNQLNNRLVPLVHKSAVVSVQNPIRLADSEPQPDLAVLLPYTARRPRTPPLASEVMLVIEVADTTIAYDRSVKVPLYGRAGIPEVWLVDLAENAIEVYRGPSAAGYRKKETYGRGDVLRAEGLPDLVLNVDDILGALPTD